MAWSKSSPNKGELFPEDVIEVGAIINAYGVKGWLKIMPYACVGLSGGALLSTKSWWLFKGGNYSVERVLSSKKHGTITVAQLAGYSNRDQALAVCGSTVYVRRSDFPVLGSDEYYWVDLIGLVVLTMSSNVLGHVVNLLDNGAHTILCVEYDKVERNGLITKAERLIPFVDTYVKKIDLLTRYVMVDWGVDY
ncbi:ribosome maturation factor RimM [Candidatus Vallotia lariciata]|uniref:ribosome maturation factor RimM n=1 Tax=Candidatus Vallotia laricis TaxID=2018052 RepID=UPI001D003073|nr:ribosome maturation factor RimM [Candidatus Vallotia lariciata]UDG83207.1 Ribosome maturation factor RimM [Candidatus Vallotia lariciata]